MRLVLTAISLVLSAALCLAKPLVVATHTVVADLAREVAGEVAEVRCLIPVGVDPHTYEPKPADVRLLSRAQLVIENGLGLEPWTTRLVRSSGFTGPVIKAAGGTLPHPVELGHAEHDEHAAEHDHTHESDIDPHAWHDVRNAQHYVRQIRDAMKTAFPEAAAAIEANAEKYLSVLETLHEKAVAEIGAIPAARRRFVTSHDALAYLGHAYGLTVIAVAGTRPDQEPSARELADLVKTIRRENVPAVFFETTTNPKLAQLVAKEAGVAVIDRLYTDSLGAPDSPGSTYVGMFRSNVETLVRALK